MEAVYYLPIVTTVVSTAFTAAIFRRWAARERPLHLLWWGAGVANTRYQPASTGGVTAPMMPRMKLKWAFGFPGVSSARSQPANPSKP